MSCFGHYLCHGHRVQWLSRGGESAEDNTVLVCPNDHAAIHRCDAPLDYADLAFVFERERVAVRVNRHLGV